MLGRAKCCREVRKWKWKTSEGKVERIEPENELDSDGVFILGIDSVLYGQCKSFSMCWGLWLLPFPTEIEIFPVSLAFIKPSPGSGSELQAVCSECRLWNTDVQNNPETFFINLGNDCWKSQPHPFFYSLILLKLSHLYLHGRMCSIATSQWNCLSQQPQPSKNTINQSCIIFFLLLI